MKSLRAAQRTTQNILATTRYPGVSVQKLHHPATMQLPRERQESAHSHQTIVIGAGISGLACAARLLERNGQNDHSVLVLEARDRIGGRIESVYVNDNRLDTGANWIHGTGEEGNRNPILDFVPESAVRELRSSVAFRPRSPNQKSSAPRLDAKDLVIPPNVSSTLFAGLWQLLGSLHQRAADLSPEASRDTSILDTICRDQSFKDAFQSIPKEYHTSLTGLPQILEGMEAAPLNHQSSENREDAAGMSLLEYATDGFEGEQVFLRDGYTTVIDKLAKKLVDGGHIKLNSEVTQINYTDNLIRVETKDAVYTAKNVVCTLPLGVLKGHLSTKGTVDKPLISPALPAEKLEAISTLGFGTLDKIFLAFESPWWKEEPFSSIIQEGLGSITENSPEQAPSEPDGFRGFTSELSGIHVSPEGVTSGACGLFVVNLHALTGFPVLSTFVSCATAHRVEAMPDAEAAAIVHRALTEWFGGNAPPAPRNVHVTRWHQDPFARGSYSNMITGVTERRHRDTFATPIVNAHGATLRFAGEHTSLEDFATAHGALLSGWREADAILADGS